MGARHALVMPTWSRGFRSLYHRPVLWLVAQCWAWKSPPRLGARGWSVVLREVHPSTPCRLGGCPGPLPLHPHLHSLGAQLRLASTLLTPAQGLPGRSCWSISGWGVDQPARFPSRWNTVKILLVTRDAQSWPRFKQRGDTALSGTQTQQISLGGYCTSRNSSHTWVTNAHG